MNESLAEMRSEPRAEGSKNPKKSPKTLSMAQQKFPTPKGTSRSANASSSNFSTAATPNPEPRDSRISGDSQKLRSANSGGKLIEKEVEASAMVTKDKAEKRKRGEASSEPGAHSTGNFPRIQKMRACPHLISGAQWKGQDPWS